MTDTGPSEHRQQPAGSKIDDYMRTAAKVFRHLRFVSGAWWILGHIGLMDETAAGGPLARALATVVDWVHTLLSFLG